MEGGGHATQNPKPGVVHAIPDSVTGKEINSPADLRAIC